MGTIRYLESQLFGSHHTDFQILRFNRFLTFSGFTAHEPTGEVVQHRNRQLIGIPLQ